MDYFSFKENSFMQFNLKTGRMSKQDLRPFWLLVEQGDRGHVSHERQLIEITHLSPCFSLPSLPCTFMQKRILCFIYLGIIQMKFKRPKPAIIPRRL
jgi:hypothetical protein